MTLPTGQQAIVLSILTLCILPLLKMFFDRQGFFLQRRSETEKMFLARLASVELELKGKNDENEKLRAANYELREQHLADETTQARVRYLEQECAELRKRIASNDGNLGL